jgi:hypothetical protein
VREIALENLAACLAELLGRHRVRDESLIDALFRVKLEQL